MPLDRAQFQDLFRAQRDRVFRFLLRLTGNAADADDLLQEAFLATWRNRMQFNGHGRAEGWVMTTAYHLFLNSHRKRTRRRSIAERRGPLPAAGPVEDGIERDDATRFLVARVEEALQDLPDEPREAFLLFRFEEIPVPEIARMMGCPVKTAESRIRRATELLAERLLPWKDRFPVPPATP